MLPASRCANSALRIITGRPAQSPTRRYSHRADATARNGGDSLGRYETGDAACNSVGPPDHRDRSCQTAAHVEGQKFFRAFDLARAGLVREVLICFVNLAHA